MPWQRVGVTKARPCVAWQGRRGSARLLATHLMSNSVPCSPRSPNTIAAITLCRKILKEQMKL